MHILFVSFGNPLAPVAPPAVALLAGAAKSLGHTASSYNPLLPVPVSFTKDAEYGYMQTLSLFELETYLDLAKSNFQSHLTTAQFDIIAFCTLYSDQRNLLKACLSVIPASILVIAGGYIFDTKEYSFPRINIVFKGLAETVFYDWLQKGCPTDQSTLHGTGAFLDILPDYSLFDWSLYKCPPYTLIPEGFILGGDGLLRGDNLAVVEYSRGCTNGCDYCTCRFWYKGLSVKSYGHIKAELAHLKTCGVRALYFADLCVNTSISVLEEFCHIVSPYGFKWCSFFQPMTLSDAHIKMLVDSGCQSLWIGIESFSESYRTKLGKRGCDGVDYMSMLRNLHNAGVKMVIPFIVSSDLLQSAEEFRYDLDVASLLASWGCKICVSPLRVTPESTLYKRLSALGTVSYNADTHLMGNDGTDWVFNGIAHKDIAFERCRTMLTAIEGVGVN